MSSAHSKDRFFFIIEMGSYGAGLSLTNEISKLDPDVEVLEIFQIPLGSAVLGFASNKLREHFEKEIPQSSGLLRSNLISNLDDHILRALYSIENSEAKDQILVIEDECCANLILIAQRSVQEGSFIVDLKLPRGGVKRGHLILTSDSASKLEALQEKIRESQKESPNHGILVRSLSDRVRRLF